VSGHCRTWLQLTAAVTSSAIPPARAELADRLIAVFKSEGARMLRVAHMLNCQACRTWNRNAVLATLTFRKTA
jgi:hypothetical protein